MDADADNHSEEGISLPCVDAHIMKMVVIQHPVVHPFTGSAVIVDFLIFHRSPGDRGVETDVPVGFCVDTAAVRRGRTFFLTGAGTHFATGEGTAPFAGMLLFTVPPVDHTEPGHAQGCAVFIDGDGVRDGIRAAAVGIKVNKRPDLPFLAEPISGIVVMGGVQADVPDRDIRVDGPEFPEGDDGADAVVWHPGNGSGAAGRPWRLHYGSRACKGYGRNKRLPHHCPSPSVRPDLRNGVYRDSPGCPFPHSCRPYAHKGKRGNGRRCRRRKV